MSLLCLGWLGVASCSTTPGPETFGNPKPLNEVKAPVRTAPAEKDSTTRKKPAGLPDASELLMTQSDLLPRAQRGGDDESDFYDDDRPVRRKGKLFSLSAQDAEIKTVLLALSNEIKQNIIIDPAINENVTVDLKDVSLKEALDNLLTPLKLQYRLDGNFIHVLKRKMTTRMFRMNYIISRRSGASNLQSTSGQGTGGASTLGGGASGNQGALGGGLGGQNVSGASTTGSGRTFTNLFTSEETDLWREIYFGLRRMVTNGDQSDQRPDIVQANTNVAGGGTLRGGGISNNQNVEGESGSEVPATNPEEPQGFFTLNRQAGIVIVKDYPEKLNQVAEFLEAIEGSSHRQVFILAKILEVKLRDEFKLGIDWSKVSPLSVIHEPVGGSLVSQIDPATNTTRNVRGQEGNLNLFESLGTTLAGSSGFIYGLSNTQIHILIDALGQQGNVSVLSSPKIATLNNQRAVIKVGTEDIFFIPQVSQGAGNNAAAITTFLPSSLTIGIVLDVLPQINGNGEVMMSINTSITEKAGEKSSPDGNSIPIVEVRESNNVVLANSGQTIVIGGLMKNKKTNDTNQVPLLGDIPFIGRLFQHEAAVDDKTELVIMLTPQVMAGLAIDEKRRSEEERLKNFMTPIKN